MAAKKPYVRLITKEDILEEFGYNLEEMVTEGGFNNKLEAVESWLNEAAESIADVIRTKMGIDFLRRLNAFVSDPANVDDVLFEGLYWSQMYEMRFFIDNGRTQATNKIDPNIKKHDEQAIRMLYSYGIVRDVIY